MTMTPDARPRLHIDATVAVSHGTQTVVFGPFAEHADAERALIAFMGRENAVGAVIRDPGAPPRLIEADTRTERIMHRSAEASAALYDVLLAEFKGVELPEHSEEEIDDLLLHAYVRFRRIQRDILRALDKHVMGAEIREPTTTNPETGGSQ